MADDNSDDNHTSMPYQAIIVLCLVGAGAAVLCAWAMFRHFGSDDGGGRVERGDGLDSEGLNQQQYMRLVRMRNQEDLQRKYGHYNYARPPKMMMQSSVSSY